MNPPIGDDHDVERLYEDCKRFLRGSSDLHGLWLMVHAGLDRIANQVLRKDKKYAALMSLRRFFADWEFGEDFPEGQRLRAEAAFAESPIRPDFEPESDEREGSGLTMAEIMRRLADIRADGVASSDSGSDSSGTSW
jgi:hypothetical protein